jgi:hypothetical protein
MMNNPEITALLMRVDKACARMNDGLSAFASVLAVLVICLGVIRASQYANALSDSSATPPNLISQPFFGVSPYN